jgi:TetR/AcrR family transcriptional repressor of nem operon
VTLRAAIAAAKHSTAIAGALFASSPYHQPADPLERILPHIDFRKNHHIQNEK